MLEEGSGIAQCPMRSLGLERVWVCQLEDMVFVKATSNICYRSRACEVIWKNFISKLSFFNGFVLSVSKALRITFMELFLSTFHLEFHKPKDKDTAVQALRVV